MTYAITGNKIFKNCDCSQKKVYQKLMQKGKQLYSEIQLNKLRWLTSILS